MKRCPCCDETKALEDFHRDRKRSDGLHPDCKACNIRKNAEWAKKNRAYHSYRNARNRKLRSANARAKWAAIAAAAAAEA